MNKTFCEKCQTDISNCNYKKHYNVCNGKKIYKKFECCPYCFKTHNEIDGQFQNHVRWCLKNPNRNKTKKEKVKKEIRKKLSKEEISKKISVAMKKCHAEGRHPGWSFINKDINRRSYPEKVIFNFIQKNDLNVRFKIVEKCPISKYFLDFAFIDLKIDLEVDGKQHYSNKEAIEHDKVRNVFLENKGWKIYRINWAEFLKNKIAEFEKFLEFVNNIDSKTSVYYDISEIILKPKKKYGNIQEFNRKRIEENDKQFIKNNDDYLKNINYNFINFNKFGWGSRLKKDGIKNPRKFLRLMLPEFYKNYIKRIISENSQYRTCWIMNEKENKKIKKEDLEKYLELGWVKGRKMNFNNI